MEIKAFTIRDLAKALDEDTLWQGPVLPITRHRALAQVNNPRAEPDDLALLVAYEDGAIVSYLGVLPDKIYVGDQEHKMGWVSCWWSDPNNRNPASLMLLMKALRAYPDGVGVCGLTKSAAEIYDRMPQFAPLQEIHGILGVVRPGGVPRAASQRYEWLERYVPLFDALSAPLDWAVRGWQRAWAGAALRRDGLRFEYLPALDDEASRFIEAHRRSELLRRGKPELDWMLTHPWVLRAPLSDRNAGRYYFSSAAREFYFLCFKVFEKDGGMAGLVILRIRDDEMTVPYAYWRPGAERAVARAIALHLVRSGAKTFRMYNEDLIGIVRAHVKGLFVAVPLDKRAVLPKKFGGIGSLGLCIQDGDADNAFI